MIQQHLDLLTIAPHLQRLFETGRLKWSLCEALARLSPAGQEDAASTILHKDLGVQSARRLILPMAAQAPAVESPFQEVERLELMIKQLRRMQRTIEYQGHARKAAQ